MQSKIEIVPARQPHIGEIVALERATFTLPWSADSFMAELENEDSHFTAALLDGQVTGFCILRSFLDEGEILNIAVDKSHRGKKIGSALLSEALGYANAKSVKRVFLEVRKSNAPAINLYLNHGFQPISVRKNYYDQPKEDAIIMMRVI